MKWDGIWKSSWKRSCFEMISHHKTQTDDTSLGHLTCARTCIELRLKTACQELTRQMPTWRQMSGEKFTTLIPFSLVPTQNKLTRLWRFQSGLKVKKKKVITAKLSIRVLTYVLIIVYLWSLPRLDETSLDFTITLFLCCCCCYRWVGWGNTSHSRGGRTKQEIVICASNSMAKATASSVWQRHLPSWRYVQDDAICITSVFSSGKN